MSAEKLMQAFKIAHDNMQIKGVVQGIVKDVDGYNSCTVEVMPGLELYDVRLNSVTGLTQNQMTCKPAVGSKVLVAIIENVKTEAAVIKFGELDELYINIGSLEFRVKAGKVKIEKNGVNLGGKLDAYITEVKKIVVIYGQGPDVAALTQIALDLKQILD